MSSALSCWKCGESLAALSLPLTRLDECPKCRAQLHVCRMCERFAPRLPKGCSEDDATGRARQEGGELLRLLQPSAKALTTPPTQQAEQAAKSALDSLFK